MDKYDPVIDISPSKTYVAVIHMYDKKGKLTVVNKEFEYKIKWPDLEHNTADWAYSYFRNELWPLTDKDRELGCGLQKIVSIEKFKEIPHCSICDEVETNHIHTNKKNVDNHPFQLNKNKGS